MKTVLACLVVLCTSMGAAVAQPEFREGAEFRAPDEIETHLIKVLRTTNKAQTNRYVPKVYDFRHVNPYDTVRFIRRCMQIEEGAWFIFGKPEDPNDPDSVNSGKVVVMAPTYQIPYLDKLMATIDTRGLTTSSGDKMFYYRPRHRYVSDPDWESVVEAVLTPQHSGGDQRADTEVNAFLFYDSPSGIEDIKRWLPILDQPPSQVMVETTIYEINVENDDRLGLDYVAWKNGPGRELFQLGAYMEKEKIFDLEGTVATPSPLYDSGVSTWGLPGHKFHAEGRHSSYLFNVSSAFFDYLVSKQKARVLTSAKVLAQNNQPASLEVGDYIFYWRDNNDPEERCVAGDARWRLLGDREGVFLEVTPLVGTEGINLAVDLEVISHTGFDSYGVPHLVSRDYSTELRVKDGEEVVLGGYSREMMVQQTSKIPLLGDLPVLGYLFGGEENLVKRRQLVAVLRAHIVTDFSAMSGAGSEIDAALIRARASREWPTENLETEVGFDQWLLDAEETE